jgi:hypothetical protein
MVFLRDTFRVRDDDDGIVADGERVRTPMLLMDGDRQGETLIGRRPGYGVLDDDQVTARRHARAAMVDASRDAWRAKKRPPDPPDDDDVQSVQSPLSSADARALSRASYDRMCSRLQDAWKTPSRDAAQPDQGTPPSELMRRHLHGADDPDDVVAIKEEAYRSYARNLSEAWKHPPHAAVPVPAILGVGPKHRVVEPTDPSAASRIERLGERTRGGR